MKKAILQVKNVTKIYNDNSVKAVNDVSLDISEGEIVAIIGPSGFD
jgi:ABC-type oligopeptide transport system ATPase subunit